MTFAQIPPGAAVFLDANSLVYHFTNDSNSSLAMPWSSRSCRPMA